MTRRRWVIVAVLVALVLVVGSTSIETDDGKRYGPVFPWFKRRPKA